MSPAATPRAFATRRALLSFGVTLLFAACHRAAEAPVVHARFGVFFGGDVQERDEVPLIFDRTRQSIGIRLDFASPPTSAERVTWELEKPAAGKKAEGTVVDYGEARTRPGEAVLDVPLAFRQGDRTGSWRVRVALDGKRILERAFKVVPATDAANE
jgi:hypothetical protein